MPAITVKNIPEALYEELKQVAAQHHRSINSEIIMCLTQAIMPKKISPTDRLNDIQALRSRVRAGVIEAAEIDREITKGRP